MNTTTQNTATTDNGTPTITVPGVGADLGRFFAFAAGLAGAAMLLRAELAPLGAGIASGVLGPHALGQMAGLL